VLKITIELWPFGDKSRRVVIAAAEIWNDGTSDHRPAFGNYEGRFWSNGLEVLAKRIEGHKRDEGAWALLAKFLVANISPNTRTSEDEPGLSEKSSDS
jgi:hypothetical protein